MSSAAKPLLSANWFRVAAVRPRLRDHVRITRQHFRGERWYVLEDLAESAVHRFSPAAQAAIGMMDGEHTLDRIWHALESLGEERPTQDELIHLMAQLDSANLLATERLPDLHELSDRASRIASGKVWRRVLNPLYLRIPLFDPDKFLDATVGLVRPLWSVWGLIVWSVVILMGAIEAAYHWTDLTHDLADRVMAKDNLLILALTFPVLKLFHEMGHCYAAKLCGSAVHEAGIMTLVVMPVPYVDVTGAGALSNKWRRAVIGAAGMLTELFFAAIAMMVWVNVEPGLVRATAFNCLLIAGVSTLLFNGNPLLRFDAYFILSDLTEIPNLGARATRFYAYLVNRYAFGLRGQSSPARTPGEASWFAFYGAASYVYRLWVMISIALFVATQLHGVGALLAGWTMITAIVYPVAKGIWYVVRSPVVRPRRLQAIGLTGGVCAALALLLFAVELPYGTVTEGIIWAPDGSDLRAGTEGRVETVAATPGTMLAQGARVITLADPILDARVSLLTSELREIELRLTAAEATDQVQAQMLRRQVMYFRSQLNDAGAKQKQLDLRAPASGRFAVLMPRDLQGKYLRRGELIGYVLNKRSAIVRVIVPQSEIELVRDNTLGVDLRLASRPLQVLHAAQVSREVPTATRELPSPALGTIGGGTIPVDPSDEKHVKALEVVFQMDVPLPDDGREYRIGERVFVRFAHDDRTLGWRIGRSMRQLFLRRFEI